MFFNLQNGKRYVGSAKDIYNRLHTHLSRLSNNTAHNQHFQNAWNKYGEENFIYGVLEYCSLENQFIREQHYITCLSPEYNLTENVIANFGHSPTQETRNKISQTLKERYSRGEILTYKQEHNWIKCYIYDFINLLFVKECNCLNDAYRYLQCTRRNQSQTENATINGRYVISKMKFTFKHELQNYLYENILCYRGKHGKYLVVKNQLGQIYYYKSISECAKANNASASTLRKNTHFNEDVPYTIRSNGYKLYVTNKFIPISTNDAVPIEESSELLQTNIGEGWDANTEINEETKESSSSYSVEIEPDLSE